MRAERIAEWEDGYGWLAVPDELMQRSSHVIEGKSGSWLIDPLDGQGVENLLPDASKITGIVLTLDRHQRDCAYFARKFDVPVALARPLRGVEDELACATESTDRFCADTGWSVLPLLDGPGWHEIALVSEDEATVWISEVVGTAPYFCAPGELLGVHPIIRLRPPRKRLAPLAPERIVVGHGRGILTDGTRLLQEAMHNARRRAPQAYVNFLKIGLRRLL